MSKTSWDFALPDPHKNDYEKERFSAMSDILYTYLYSISKHNPLKYTDGTYAENWNYIYLDKYKDYPRYNASAVYRKLNMSKSTYYRRMETLKKYNLVYESKDDQGRRILKIPFIQSKMILPVKTCEFFTRGEKRSYSPDDIIKLMAIIKIYYYGQDKYFTMRQLRTQMGYSITHNDKDAYLRELLTILRGFNIVKWNCSEISLQNNRTEIRYEITHFDDSYNSIMEGFRKDMDYIDVTPLTEEERIKLFPIE